MHGMCIHTHIVHTKLMLKIVCVYERVDGWMMNRQTGNLENNFFSFPLRQDLTVWSMVALNSRIFCLILPSVGIVCLYHRACLEFCGIFDYLNISEGAGEMTQWPRALTVLAEDLGLTPTFHIIDYNIP